MLHTGESQRLSGQHWSSRNQQLICDESQRSRTAYDSKKMHVDMGQPTLRPFKTYPITSGLSSSNTTRQTDRPQNGNSMDAPSRRLPAGPMQHSDLQPCSVSTTGQTRSHANPQLGKSERHTAPSFQQHEVVYRADGKPFNRYYYPSARHQDAFDTLLSANPVEFDRREREGLNTLSGELNEPPIYSTPIIIQCAILGSPQQSLTLSELRVTLKIRFQYYDVADLTTVKSWERTLLRTLSDHSRFQCSKRMGPSGATWTINHNAPPIKCIPKRQCHIRKKIIRLPAAEQQQQPNHHGYYMATHAIGDSDTMESDRPSSIASSSGSRNGNGNDNDDAQQSLFPLGPAPGHPHGPQFIKLPPLPESRKEWCPTSPRWWSGSGSGSEISLRDT